MNCLLPQFRQSVVRRTGVQGRPGRLAEGGIKCELHKFRTEERAAQAAKRKAPAERPGISEEALREAEDKLNLL